MSSKQHCVDISYLAEHMHSPQLEPWHRGCALKREIQDRFLQVNRDKFCSGKVKPSYLWQLSCIISHILHHWEHWSLMALTEQVFSLFKSCSLSPCLTCAFTRLISTISLWRLHFIDLCTQNSQSLNICSYFKNSSFPFWPKIALLVVCELHTVEDRIVI